MGILGYLMESSPDVRTCMQQLYTYNPVFGNMFFYEYREAKDGFSIVYRPAEEWWNSYSETARQAIETSMTRTIAILRQFTGIAVWPQSVALAYPQPIGAGNIYFDLLKCQPQFSADENTMVFDTAVAELPIKSYNPLLFRQFSEIAQQALQSVNARSRLGEQVRQLLLSQMGEQLLSIEQTAAQLGMSVRTLQRKLEQENISFQSLLEQVRQDLALAFLERKGTTTGEIAHFLGYSDTSAFRRAFKRWTGQPPSAFRGS